MSWLTALVLPTLQQSSPRNVPREFPVSLVPLTHPF
jgi:hypothetical protein